MHDGHVIGGANGSALDGEPFVMSLLPRCHFRVCANDAGATRGGGTRRRLPVRRRSWKFREPHRRARRNSVYHV